MNGEMKLKLNDEPRLNTEDRSAHHAPMKARARRFVVVVDDSEEAQVAIRFAAGRAAHIEGGGLVLFHCVRPAEFSHWIGVADRMLQEAHAEANEMMDRVVERMEAYCGIHADIHIAEGEPKEELKSFIEEAGDIFMLVLGANKDGEQPGPLVDYFSGPLVGSLKCPLMIVPGAMTNDDVDSMV